jgi:hypothetical protein
MGKRQAPDDRTCEIDIISIRECGITLDFFGEVPPPHTGDRGIDFFIDMCKSGVRKTYTERYAAAPTILAKSDPSKVQALDQLMTEAMQAATIEDRETIREKIRAIYAFRPGYGK